MAVAASVPDFAMVVDPQMVIARTGARTAAGGAGGFGSGGHSDRHIQSRFCPCGLCAAGGRLCDHIKCWPSRIAPFLASRELMRSFDWSDGEAIDCRSFQVTLARSDARTVDRCIISFIDHSSRRQTERSLRREMVDGQPYRVAEPARVQRPDRKIGGDRAPNTRSLSSISIDSVG